MSNTQEEEKINSLDQEQSSNQEHTKEIENKDNVEESVEGDPEDDVDYWKEFQLGTRSVFKKWTAMRMAVDRGWGGRGSAEKEEILIQSVIDLLGIIRMNR